MPNQNAALTGRVSFIDEIGDVPGLQNALDTIANTIPETEATVETVISNGSIFTTSLVGRTLPATIFVFPAVGDSIKIDEFDAANGWRTLGTFTVPEFIRVYRAPADVNPPTQVRAQKIAGAGTTSRYGVMK